MARSSASAWRAEQAEEVWLLRALTRRKCAPRWGWVLEPLPPVAEIPYGSGVLAQRRTPTAARALPLLGAIASCLLLAAPRAYAQAGPPAGHEDAAFDFMNFLAHRDLHD